MKLTTNKIQYWFPFEESKSNTQFPELIKPFPRIIYIITIQVENKNTQVKAPQKNSHFKYKARNSQLVSICVLK